MGLLSSFPWPTPPSTLQKGGFPISWDAGSDLFETGQKPLLEMVTCADNQILPEVSKSSTAKKMAGYFFLETDDGEYVSLKHGKGVS